MEKIRNYFNQAFKQTKKKNRTILHLKLKIQLFSMGLSSRVAGKRANIFPLVSILIHRKNISHIE